MAQQEELVALQKDNEQLRSQFTTLATERASLRERIGRSSRNSSKPLTSAKLPAAEGRYLPLADRIATPQC
jgi:hypothetical protein